MKYENNEAEFAARVCRILDQDVAGIDARVAEKLRHARQRAVARQAELSLATASATGGGHGIFQSLHRHHRGVLATLALLMGAFGMHVWQEHRELETMAEIDMALLSDEVSPGAYLDQGFMAWLDRLSQHEEYLLPE